jgi:hypothetical protein
MSTLNAKVWKTDIFDRIIKNKNLYKISNDGVSVLKLPCKISVKGTMFQQCKIHEYTWTSLDGKMHNQTDHATTDR